VSGDFASLDAEPDSELVTHGVNFICENDVRDEEEQPAASHTGGKKKWNAKVFLLAGHADMGHSSYTSDDHISRVLKFIVAKKSRSELLALGGAWSQELDGGNPEKNDSCLIKTAIRCVKEFADIDLTKVTKWNKFMTLVYHRPAEEIKGKMYDEQTETTVIYVPDITPTLPLPDQYTAALKTRFTEFRAKQAEELKKKAEEAEKKKAEEAEKKKQAEEEAAKAAKEEKDEKKDEKVDEKDEKMEDADSKDDKKDKKEEVKEEPPTEEQEWEKFRAGFSETPAHFARTRKAAKQPVRVQLISLDGLLDYNEDDKLEKTFEISLFAEVYNERLQYKFASQLFDAFKAAPEPEKEEPRETSEKRKREDEEREERKRDKDSKDKDAGDEKRSKGADGEKVKEEEKKELTEEEKKAKKEAEEEARKAKKEAEEQAKKEAEAKEEAEVEAQANEYVTIKVEDATHTENYKVATTTNHELLAAFRFFDKGDCGYIFAEDLEMIFLNLNKGMSFREVQNLVNKIAEGRSKINYRKLTHTDYTLWTGITEVPKKEEKKEEESKENGKPDEAMDEDTKAVKEEAKESPKKA